MPFKFNPFSGNFDQTGSGGGASYIDGEEATYNDLSLDAGVAPLNSAWLVRNSSGIWPFNKPGGIYIRTATGGSSRDSDYTYAGTMPDVFSDAVLTIYDEASTTRTGQFNLGSVTAGQNRVLTWPDANGTIARTQDFAAPPAIGNTTAAAANFTTVGATGAITGAEASSTSTRSLANGLQLPVASSSGAVGILSAFTAGSNELRVYSANSGGTISNMATFNAGGGLVANSIQNTPIGSTTPSTVAATTLNATGTTELVNGGTTAGPFRVYNTSSAANANFERGFMRWSSNVLQIGTEKAGTGSARALEFQTDGTTRFSISDAGAVRVFGAALRLGPNLNAGSLIFQHGDGVEAFRCQYNATFRILGRLLEMGADGTGGTIQIHTDGDNLMALRRGTTAQNLRIYNTVSGTNNVNFERANFRWASNEFIIDAEFGGTGTALRGIKIGSATSSLLGFYGVTPVDQPATVADPAGGGTVDTEARTAINAIIDRLQELGLIA
jgi:hypothetical protein